MFTFIVRIEIDLLTMLFATECAQVPTNIIDNANIDDKKMSMMRS